MRSIRSLFCLGLVVSSTAATAADAPNEAHIMMSSKRVPVTHVPGEYVVFVSPMNSEPAENAGTTQRIEAIVQFWGFEVTAIDRCGGHWMTTEDGPCLSRELQLRPTGPPLTAQKRAALLYRLRQTPNVASAGPLIGWQTQTFALQPRLEVVLDGRMTLDASTEWIENTGLDGRLNPSSRVVSIQLTKGSGLSAVTVAERLSADPQVLSVTNILSGLDEPG